MTLSLDNSESAGARVLDPSTEGSSPRRFLHTRGKTILRLLIVAAAFFYVVGSGSSLVYSIATLVVIYAIAGLALDLIQGWAGLVFIGSAAFLAIGAYTTAILSTHAWASFPVTLVASAAVGGVVGLISGLPSLRLSGWYLALSTLALQFIVVFTGDRIQASTGHVSGFFTAPAGIGGLHFADGRALFIACCVVLGLVVMVLTNLYALLPGRMWTSIRENELAARTIGVTAARWKLTAFVATSMLTSVAGCLYAYYLHFVTSETFTFDLAISIIVITIVGGTRSIYGPILGAVFVVVLPRVLSNYAAGVDSMGKGFLPWLATNVNYISNGIYGVVILLFLLYSPGGLMALFGRLSTAAQRVATRGWPRLDRTSVRGRSVLGTQRSDVGASQASGAPKTVESAHASGVSTKGEGLLGTEPERESDIILAIRNLHVTYPNGARALSGLSLDLKRHGLHVVVGRNGAGKSTLLRSLAGFFPAEGVRMSGDIIMNGSQLAGMSPVAAVKHGIVLAPERDKVFSNLTVGEHLRVVGADLDAVSELMPAAHDVLSRRLRSKAGLLSGGERQLLALSVSAVLKPELLLVDEISLGLSPKARGDVVEAVLGLSAVGDMTIIVVEQSLVVAESLSNDIVSLIDGQARGEQEVAAFGDDQ